jgi:hypothetical protein
MNSSNGRGGWGGWILLAVIVTGAGFLYQREGGKLFGPALRSLSRPASAQAEPGVGGLDPREVEAMNERADQLRHAKENLRRQEEELRHQEEELRRQEDQLRLAREKEQQSQMDQAAELSFRYQQKKLAELREAIRKDLETEKK